MPPTLLGDSREGERGRENRPVCETTFTPQGLETTSPTGGPVSPIGYTGSAQRPGQLYTLSVTGGRG